MKKKVEKKQSLHFMIPLIIALVIIPIIVLGKKYNSGLNVNKWFSSGDSSIDFFLYFKSRAVMLLGVVMAFILGFVMYDRANQKNKVKQKTWDLKIWVPVGLYGLFVLLSAALSEHATTAFWGGFEQFEPALAVLSYLVIMLYAYYFVNEERDIEYLFKPILIGITVFSLIGLSQYLKIDYFKTDFAKSLLTMGDGQLTNMNLTFTFEEGRVYGTLYNPNYIGTYVALLLSLVIGIGFATKKLWMRVLAGVNVLMLIFCLIGSQSVTGYIGLAAALLYFVIMMIPHMKKYYKQVLIYAGVVVIACAAIFIFNSSAIKIVKNKLFNVHKEENGITSIATGKDVTIKFLNGSVIHITMAANSDNSDLDIYIKDDKGQDVVRTVQTVTNNDGTQSNGYKLTVGSYRQTFIIPMKLAIGNNGEYVLGFRFNFWGKEWNFTNQYTNGTYYLYNAFGKFDQIKTIDTLGFEGYDHFASRRGFIWSRTLPLISKNIITGVGQDNFVYAFPNDDYVGMVNNNYSGQVVTKPHNMYLQIAIQSGLLSLIAYLFLMVIFMVQSIKCYFKHGLDTTESKIGLSISVGVVGYLVTGLANDSTITVAPIFWALLGLGLACNQIVKRKLKKV